MSGRALGCLGAAVLVAVWIWPLPGLPVPPFTAHMTGHMAVVAVAAPLLAAGLAGSAADPTSTRLGVVLSPIPASMVDGLAVWGWHAPALHHAARHTAWAYALEQVSFLAGGLLLWTAAMGGGPAGRRRRAVGGVIALLLTSMHMTLLGALIALTPRLLYGAHGGSSALSPLHDQQVGGVVMILLGGAVYGAGGLWLASHLLRDPDAAAGPPP